MTVSSTKKKSLLDDICNVCWQYLKVAVRFKYVSNFHVFLSSHTCTHREIQKTKEMLFFGQNQTVRQLGQSYQNHFCCLLSKFIPDLLCRTSFSSQSFSNFIPIQIHEFLNRCCKVIKPHTYFFRCGLPNDTDSCSSRFFFVCDLCL